MPPRPTSNIDLRVFVAISFAAHALAVTASVVGREKGEKGEHEVPNVTGALTGETFEIDPDAVEETLAEQGSETRTETPSAALFEADDVAPADPIDSNAPSRHTPKPARAHPAARVRGGGTPAAGSPPPPPLFGATGDRSAADLARTFTRAFASAASTSPSWRSAPLGSAGSVTIVFTLDEAGHLTSTAVGATSSPALTDSVRRTLAVIGGRSFTASGRVTRITLSAKVSADEVHDGLHGEVFALGATMVDGDGSGFFALAIGRRVDIRVHASR